MRRRSDGTTISAKSERVPKVILTPLKNDKTQKLTKVRLTCPIANEFNKPDKSDVKLIAGEKSYYAHRVVLAAGSDVFDSMLSKKGTWQESGLAEINLVEDEECSKEFPILLEYFYTGAFHLNESNMLPLFYLADKYNVQPIYRHCIKAIEEGLRVYVVPPRGASRSPSPDSCSSDEESSASYSSFVPENREILAASESFSFLVVLKLASFCSDKKLQHAALYNLEARIAPQLRNKQYGAWNDLPKEIVVKMLSDKYFYCEEMVLFKACCSWLNFWKSNPDTADEFLQHIRYPLLSVKDLYEVDASDVMKLVPNVAKLVQKAIRHKLFCNFIREEEKQGEQFQERQIKHR